MLVADLAISDAERQSATHRSVTEPYPPDDDDNWLYTVPEALAELRISRSLLNRLRREGVIETVKLGHRVAIPRREIKRLIDQAVDASD